MMRNMILGALFVGAVLVLSACGEQEERKSAVHKTVEAVDKTADHAVGKAQLEQKKKIENKLNKLQQNQQNQLNQAMQEK